MTLSRDRINALGVGADDFLLKASDVQDLLARLRAIIGRQGGHAALSNGVITLDRETR